MVRVPASHRLLALVDCETVKPTSHVGSNLLLLRLLMDEHLKGLSVSSRQLTSAPLPSRAAPDIPLQTRLPWAGFRHLEQRHRRARRARLGRAVVRVILG